MCEILVVDDSFELRRYYRELLSAEGYRVRTANDGAMALEAIFVRRPDLVLLDIDMPGRNGFATCEDIRRNDPLLPIIFLTGFDTTANELRARGLGADDFFAKDTDEAVLLAAIRRALDRAIYAANTASQRRLVKLGDLEIDFDMFTISAPGVQERITKTEADILWILNSARGKLFTYEDIFEVLRGNGYIGSDSTLYTHMSRLKKKLGPYENIIDNERGIGYRLR